jgi:DNA-binding transcriptional MerR regulator
MTPVRIFHRYRGLRNFTMRSLLVAACDLIPSLIGAQSRYKVSELPTERTLRYYMNQGLMDRPSGKKGTMSLFTYRHLLQVLAVKHLQSQYLPLRRIKVLLRGISNREIEGLLPGGRGGGKGNRQEKNSAAARATSSRPGRRADGAAVPSPGRGRWVRVEISDGIELHLREDGSGPPMAAAVLEACRVAVAKVFTAPKAVEKAGHKD